MCLIAKPRDDDGPTGGPFVRSFVRSLALSLALALAPSSRRRLRFVAPPTLDRSPCVLPSPCLLLCPPPTLLCLPIRTVLVYCCVDWLFDSLFPLPFCVCEVSQLVVVLVVGVYRQFALVVAVVSSFVVRLFIPRRFRLCLLLF